MASAERVSEPARLRELREASDALGYGIAGERALRGEGPRVWCWRRARRCPSRSKRVLVIIPDGTRTAPIPLFFRLLYEALGGRVSRLDYLIALGTHPPMSDAAIDALVGVSGAERAAALSEGRHLQSPVGRSRDAARRGDDLARRGGGADRRIAGAMR